MFTYLIPFVFYFFTFGILFWIPSSKLLSVTFKILPSYSFIHGVFAPRLSLGGEGCGTQSFAPHGTLRHLPCAQHRPSSQPSVVFPPPLVPWLCPILSWIHPAAAERFFI